MHWDSKSENQCEASKHRDELSWTCSEVFDHCWILLALQSSWVWLIWGYDCDTTVWWLCLSFRSRSQSRKGTCRNGTCMGSTQRWCLLFLAGLHTWVTSLQQAAERGPVISGRGWIYLQLGLVAWPVSCPRYHALISIHKCWVISSNLTTHKLQRIR